MELQQYLPLAVLKRAFLLRLAIVARNYVATVLTACGIETDATLVASFASFTSCNSTYRLRY